MVTCAATCALGLPLDDALQIGYTQDAMSYREIEHTADWALEVTAPEEAALLAEAARGMYALAGTRLASAPRLSRRLELSAPDLEGLLVRFLEELLYLGESEGAAYDTFSLRVEPDEDEWHLHADLGGAPIESMNKEIKAVTWHNLRVRRSPRGLHTVLVFDV